MVVPDSQGQGQSPGLTTGAAAGGQQLADAGSDDIGREAKADAMVVRMDLKVRRVAVPVCVDLDYGNRFGWGVVMLATRSRLAAPTQQHGRNRSRQSRVC